MAETPETNPIGEDNIPDDNAPGTSNVDEIEKLLQDANKDKEAGEEEDKAAFEELMAQISGLSETPEDLSVADVLDDDIPEEKLSELEEMFKMMDMKSTDLISGSANLNVSINDDSDLDSLLRQAMADADNQSLGGDLQTDSVNFVGDVTVFDEPVEGPTGIEDTRFLKTNAKKGGLSQWLMNHPLMQKILEKPLYIAGAIAVLLALTAGVMVASVWLERAPGNNIRLEMPSYTMNDANFMFTDASINLDGTDITIFKVLVSPTATVFYTKEYVDVYNHNITMTDEEGKVYYPDLNSFPARKARFTPGGTIITMQPLDGGVRQFTLTIQNPDTDSRAEIPFWLTEALEHLPAKFASDVHNADAPTPGMQVSIDNAVFAPEATTLWFKLASTDPFSRFDFHVRTDKKWPVTVLDSMRSLTPQGNGIQVFEVPNQNQLMGVAKLAPVKALADTLTVRFDNLYKDYDFYKEIPAASLTNYALPYQQVLTLGDYEVVLERAGKGQELVILVLHGRKGGLGPTMEAAPTEGQPSETEAVVETVALLSPSPSPSPSSTEEPAGQADMPGDMGQEAERVEVWPVVHLLATDANTGETFTVEGQVHSGPDGTDVVFDGSAYGEQFINIPLSNMVLSFDSFKVKMHPAQVTLDLREMGIGQEGYELEAHTAEIVNAFNSRLAYKSGMVKREEVTGFSPLLMSHLNADYAPISSDLALKQTEEEEAKTKKAKDKKTETFPAYTVQVTVLSYSPGRLDAVVKEMWRGASDHLATDFLRTHQVMAMNVDGKWVIMRDEVME